MTDTEMRNLTLTHFFKVIAAFRHQHVCLFTYIFWIVSFKIPLIVAGVQNVKCGPKHLLMD